MIAFDEHYFETEEGQHLVNAHRYLTAARVLMQSDVGRRRYTAVQTPVLHLVGHGAELLLKYPILRRGGNARAYGHDLEKLWNAAENTELRHHVLHCASEAWAEAAAHKENWSPKDDFTRDPKVVLEGALFKLSFLHGKSSDYALRYTIAKPAVAPRPVFLIETFGRAAESLSMNPSLLRWR